MEMISRPLMRTEKENRENLRASEVCLHREGSIEGNRHQRRLAAKRQRQEDRRAKVTA